MVLGKASHGKVVVFGGMFWYPYAGTIFQFLHYMIGLRRLGYDPYYVEDPGGWFYEPDIYDPAIDPARNVGVVAAILESHGFADHWALRANHPGGSCYGLTESQLLNLYQEADALLNVTGIQEIRDEHLACRRRVYVESDPFFTQVMASQGDPLTLTQLDLHDTHFSFGENLGSPDCDAPTGSIHWLPTRQPVVPDLWDNRDSDDATRYITVMTWHNANRDISYRGETYYWTKDRELMNFIELPSKCAVEFQLALTAEEDLSDLLRPHGWSVANAREISKDMDRYRDFIQHSRGEFSVARDQYVRPRTGWFSDRSACYLAAGRPVITQETGFNKVLPTGTGLFGFRTMEEITEAIDTIERDYQRHCDAAREIANEYFAADKVLSSLMVRAGL
jgi:hypothetical protein